MASARTPGDANPRVPILLRAVTGLECVVVFAAAVVLFFAPALGRDIWAWSVAPYNARYIGAIYFAALLPLMAFALSGRWSPGRVVLWMIFAFTTTIMVAMLVHADRFEWGRPATWAFWFLYLFLPVHSAVFLYRLRAQDAADAVSASLAQRRLLAGIAAVLLAYGLALMVAPGAAAGFWPWPIDDFHARVYAATFVTPAVGAWVIRAQGSDAETRCVGATLVTLSVLSIVAIAWTSAGLPIARQVDYARAGTWGFVGINAAVLLAGACLVFWRRGAARSG